MIFFFLFKKNYSTHKNFLNSSWSFPIKQFQVTAFRNAAGISTPFHNTFRFLIKFKL